MNAPKSVEYAGETFYLNDGGYFFNIKNSKIKYLHRVMWEQTNGPLQKGWVVHHKDGDPLNNRLDNLEAMPLGDHTRLHLQINTREDRLAKQRAYRNDRYAENPEPFKQAYKEYYAKNRDEILPKSRERRKLYHEANKEAENARSRRYYAEHRDEILAANRERRRRQKEAKSL